MQIETVLEFEGETRKPSEKIELTWLEFVEMKRDLELQKNLRQLANDNFDRMSEQLRKYERMAAQANKQSMLCALWDRAEELGYAPSVMGTPEHIAGNYMAHLFRKDGSTVQIKGSDGQWGDTPEQALLKLVQEVEKLDEQASGEK